MQKRTIRTSPAFTPSTKLTGFTIAELLVAIVIIGILATLTIISYIGIQQKAIVASINSDLVSSSRTLKLFQVENSAYPTNISDCPTPAEGNLCLESSPGNTYLFDAINTTTPQTFCLAARNGNNKYHITEDSVPESGVCDFAFASTLTALTTSPFTIDLTWPEVENATSYTLEQATNSSFTGDLTTIATITPPEGTSFTATNLSPNTIYYYRVNATIIDDISEWSAAAYDTTDPLDAPTAPVVTANTVTDTTTWSWPDVTASCAAGTTARYQYRYTIEPAGYDSDWTEPNDPEALSIGFTTSAEGYTYSLEVQAQCYLGDGASSWSTSNAGSSDDYYRPMTTPALTATTVSSTAIDLSWTPITGATSYTLQQATNSSFTSDLTTLATITPPDDTIFSSTGLSSGITYYYRVNKTSAGGTSDWSATESATTTVDAPSAPTVTANTIAGTTTWSWPGVTCPSGTTAQYRYDYFIDSVSQAPSGWKTPIVPAATSIAFTTSTEGHTYTVEVQAQCYTVNTTSSWSISGQDSYYRIVTYTLTISAGTGGLVNTAVNGTYNTGSTPTITATPNSYHTFTSWTGSTGCSGVASHTITMDAAKSCTANFGSSYIQTITAASCPSTRTQVQDARDSHTYWVQKLADGKCWMLTNLGYAGSGTNTYSDIKTLTNGTGGSMTYTVASYYVTPSTTNFTTEPTAPSTSTTGLGQYGYLYNWCAAMGGQATAACANATTPTPITTTSICPSGWRLPAGSEFGVLNTAINGGSTTTEAGLIGAPWLAQRGGYWGGGFSFQGNYGYYWSYTQNSALYAYDLVFFSGAVYPTTSYMNKNFGYAVRCIAV